MGPNEINEIERLGNSQRVDHLVRALWSQAIADGQGFVDPGDRDEADAFTAWLREPAEQGARHGVNRYLYAAYLTRPDLQAAFANLDAADGRGLMRWAACQGRYETLAELLPNAQPLSVNVIGFLSESLGLGEAGRLYANGLASAGVLVSTTTVSPDAPGAAADATVPGAAPSRRDGSQPRRDLVADTPPAFNLACVNADFLIRLVNESGPGSLGGVPTIGQWGWETDVLPAGWVQACSLVDEVWVYSSFVATNLGRLLPIPVVVVPPPVIAPVPDGPSPIADDRRFTFLCMLDLFSTPARKNPGGAIDAYLRAFGPEEGFRLVVKTLNGTHRPEALADLRRVARDRPDIVFLDGYLSPGQKGALLAGADCFVSLHRSEGFGLALAESMTLGTPVLATGYSGNMDFTTPENSWLVDWHPTSVGPGAEVYPAEGHWAEPDLDHAAAQMRRVASERDLARSRADRAREDIVRLYAPRTAGEIARARLELLSTQPRRDEPTSSRSGGLSSRARRLRARRI